jgi:hypothetical protein
MERTEDEILAGAPFTVVLGGISKSLVPLTIAAGRVWQRHLVDTLNAKSGVLDGSTGWGEVARLFVGLTDEELDVLLAYDETAALGGREWIEAHATATEVHEAFKEVCYLEFPLLREARSFPQLIAMLLGSLSGRSTSSASTNGPSALPDSSKPSSPASSSGSSSGSSASAGGASRTGDTSRKRSTS